MRRREFIALVGGVATGWPLAVHAQQPSVPVVGFLRSTPSNPFTQLVTAFRDGLKRLALSKAKMYQLSIAGRKITWAACQVSRLIWFSAGLPPSSALAWPCGPPRT